MAHCVAELVDKEVALAAAAEARNNNAKEEELAKKQQSGGGTGTGSATDDSAVVTVPAVPRPPEQRYLVIAGRGHMQHGFGVPERIFERHPELGIGDQSLLVVTARGSDYGMDVRAESDASLLARANRVFVGCGSSSSSSSSSSSNSDDDNGESDGGGGGVPAAAAAEAALPPAADVVFVYDDIAPAVGAAQGGAAADARAVKAETADAYNRVGASAHLAGNLCRAHAVMRFLDYDDELIALAGDDAYNFQGVGNPHALARIGAGERVLDLGSGLGVDSFLAAARACGGDSDGSGAAAASGGEVVGVDIARNEVEHAAARAAARGVDDHVSFTVADMEALPHSWSDSFDVCISNGAFCLAPDKEAAFREVYRTLAPGGRMAVATSTVRGDALPEGVEWPICMRMFIPLEEIAPLCERIGFVNVTVDTAHTEMTFELEEEEELARLDDEAGGQNPNRHRVHVGSPEFGHLEQFDMNTICARVVVYAEKPAAATAA